MVFFGNLPRGSGGTPPWLPFLKHEKESPKEELHVEKKWVVLPSSKLTWQWKIIIFNREYIFNRSIFHCHVSLPEGTIFI